MTFRFDQSELAVYFQYDNVIETMFALGSKLFGITFQVSVVIFICTFDVFISIILSAGKCLVENESQVNIKVM